MTAQEKKFLANSREKVQDLDHRKKMNHALQQSDDAFLRGKGQFEDLDLAKRLARHTKWTAISRLDEYLLEFERNFTARGGRVIWAETATEAFQAIHQICEEKNAKTVVKSKSMVTEEIHLNEGLSKAGIEVIETDLGEYIQQLAGEAPYHIVAPSLHKSRGEVADLFHDKLGADVGLMPEELTRFARGVLRDVFRTAEVGITGANFLLADVGGVVLTENEGNGRLSTGFPKTHIAVAGIEKILPSVDDLGLFLPLLATHGSGQHITVYNSIFTGPKAATEADGPEEMYVVLVDNGRTQLLADPVARESLHCIRCGACLNVCPVYKNIGGHAYDTTYSGPIGSVITPHLKDMGTYKHLSYASSLCGACTEVCPVGIPLHGLLLHNRMKAVVSKHQPLAERLIFKGWERMMLSRKLMDAGGGRLKNHFMSYAAGSIWGKDRRIPRFAKRTFSQQWRLKERGNGKK